MVKKHVFHDKAPNIQALKSCLDNVYKHFIIHHGDQLSIIYQANITKLTLRHPLDKGYTNEGQNARADEIIAQCNPCACDRGGEIKYSYDMLPNKHGLTCSYCGFGAFDKDVAMAIEKWNSVNIDAPVVLDPCGNCGTTDIRTGINLDDDFAICNNCKAFVTGDTDELRQKWNARQAEIRAGNELCAQAYAIATGGNAEQTAAQYEGKTASQTLHDNTQALVAALDNTKQALFNVFNSLLVKKTADELPEPMVPVLVWTSWPRCYAWLANDQWEYDTDYCSISECHYWLPLPTFNPESE